MLVPSRESLLRRGVSGGIERAGYSRKRVVRVGEPVLDVVSFVPWGLVSSEERSCCAFRLARVGTS